MDKTKIHENLLQQNQIHFQQVNATPLGAQGPGSIFIDMGRNTRDRNVEALLDGTFELWEGESTEMAERIAMLQ